jgi:hypothetical protein
MSGLATALPYGMRDCKIYPYADALGSILGSVGYDLPNMQTFSFAEAEEYTDLRGDDSLVATHGNGAQVNWSLEAGGISLTIWAILTGGQIIETGAAPNRVITLRKLSDDARPYFRVDGQIISDAGGDVHAVVYRAKCNGDISGQFGDGAFFVTAADGVGLPMIDTKLLYDIVQYESKTDLQTEDVVNPVLPPRSSSVIISALEDDKVTLNWEDVVGATEYVLQKSVDGGQSWGATTPTGTQGTNAKQSITLGGTPASGSFQLAYGGYTTNAIAFDANDSAIKAALVALPNIGTADVDVVSKVVEFKGALAARPIDLMTAVNNLGGGSNPSVTLATTQIGVIPASTLVITGLAASTSHLFRIQSKSGDVASAYCKEIGPIVTPAA